MSRTSNRQQMKKWLKLVLLGILISVLYTFLPKNTVYEICLPEVDPLFYVVRKGLFGGHYIIDKNVSLFSLLPDDKLKIHLARSGFTEPYFQMILVFSKNDIYAYSSNYLESIDGFKKVSIADGFTRDKWEDLYSKRYLQDYILLEKNKVHCP